MEELLQNIKRELRSAWRYRWYALIVAWIVAPIGWAVVLTMPDVHEASARIYVDTDSLIRNVIGDIAVDADASDSLRYVQERLLSRPRLEQVARETDMDLRADTPADLDMLVTELRKDIVLRPMGGGRSSRFEQNLYMVSYRDENPVIARAVVQTLVNAFQEDALQTSQSDQAEARQFLDKQIALYEARLQEAERARAEFNRKWISYLPGEAGNYFQRLAGREDNDPASQHRIAYCRGTPPDIGGSSRRES